MEIIRNPGKSGGKDFSSPGVSSAFTLAQLRISQDIIQPRLRQQVLPPIHIGRPIQTGDALLLLTDGGKINFITTGSANNSAQEDSVGFLFGTALRAPSPKSVRGLFQDDEVRTFTDFDRVTVNNRLVLLDKGMNFFFKDKVIVDIHTTDRKTGVIEEILSSPPDTARVRLDSTGEIVPMPFRHMVLTGPGLEVPQFDSDYNVIDVVT